MEDIVAIDTNVIVRLLTKDDPEQAELARACVSTSSVFIPDTVLLETEWVLRFAYGFDSTAVVNGLRLFTFDKKFIKRSSGLGKTTVREP